MEGVNVISTEELGRGSYAVVYPAEWRGLSCVAKVFYEVLFPDNATTTWKQLTREIKLLQRIRHPNIVQLLGFIPSRIPSIVMERLDINLTKLIEKHHSLLSFDMQICILQDVAVGLNFLHTHKDPIIHRDLSSNNILLTKYLVAKISDMGLAKHIKSAKQQIGSSAGFGAQFYMPPEVLGQVPPQISPKTDMFSFGVVMLQVATGAQPDVKGILNVDAEADRRKHHLDQLNKDGVFHPLVLQCLSNKSSNRPTAFALFEVFKKLGVVRKSTIMLTEAFQEENIKLKKQLETFQLQIVLTDIKLTKEIGTGLFGKVFVAEYCGLVCVVKEFNSNITLVASSKENLFEKCQQILQLTHPNIVQFLGVYYKPGLPTVPLLVMEMMDCTLSVLLNNYPNISIDIKLFILLGVSLGLKFLHSQKPSVVHCNLSSNNILLTPDLRAKISDVEMSLIVSEKSFKKNLKTTSFTAPESTATNKSFNPSVDVYSYGVITLHTITQQLLEPKRQLSSKSNQYQSYVDKVAGDDKEIGLIVAGCLDDVPGKRPQIDEVSKQIKRITKKCMATKNVIAWQTELQQVAQQVCKIHPCTYVRNCWYL